MSLNKTLSMVFCLALLFAGLSPLMAGSREDLVAKVGAVPITRFELQRQMQKILPMQVRFHGGLSEDKKTEIRQEALKQLVERAYKVQFAIEEEIAVENGALDQAMKPFRERFASDQKLREALGEETPGDFRAAVYRELLASKAERAAVDSKVGVTDSEVAEFYRQNTSSYQRPRQFKASHIMIKVDPAANREERHELKARAEALVARARAGEDFYNLAYYNSDDRSKFVGGDLGYFHEGQTVKEFEAALLKMRPGEISDPVKTIYGYHIIKLIEVNEPRQLQFEEVAGKIRSSLEKKERQALYDDWMTELRNRFAIQYLGN